MGTTKAPVSVSEYLRMSFHPDCEYVDGEIKERNVGEEPHSEAQARLIEIFYELRRKHPFHARPELRLKVSETQYRIPDLAIFTQKPTELVPSTPPLAVIEIVSREDRYTEILEKLEEYRTWGVPHIWLVDPWLHKLHVYSSAGLSEVSFFSLPEFDVEIPIDQIL